MNLDLPTHAVHRHYRKYREGGLSRSIALDRVRREHWDDWKDMAQKQESGIVFESLDMTEEKKRRNLSIIQSGGRLP
jgi:hypothetical protein